MQKIKAHESELAPAVQKLREEAPRELAQIVARLLAKKPQQRFASAGEVAAALQSFVAGSDLAALVARGLGPSAPASQESLEYRGPGKDFNPNSASTYCARRWLWAGAAIALAGALFAVYSLPYSKVESSATSRAIDALGTSSRVKEAEPEPPATEAEPAWTALFNGQDLTGWKTLAGDSNSWSVKSGILVAQGPAPSNLYSERGDLRDFHLRAEANMSADADSGIFFRIPFPRFQNTLPYEAQIVGLLQDDYNTGGLWGFGDAKVTEMLVKPGEWFTLEIIARGNRLVLKVNAQMTVDYTDQANRFRNGHIALQHFRSTGVVQFRKIEIKELPQLPGGGDD